MKLKQASKFQSDPRSNCFTIDIWIINIEFDSLFLTFSFNLLYLILHKFCSVLTCDILVIGLFDNNLKIHIWFYDLFYSSFEEISKQIFLSLLWWLVFSKTKMGSRSNLLHWIDLYCWVFLLEHFLNWSMKKHTQKTMSISDSSDLLHKDQRHDQKMRRKTYLFL